MALKALVRNQATLDAANTAPEMSTAFVFTAAISEVGGEAVVQVLEQRTMISQDARTARAAIVQKNGVR